MKSEKIAEASIGLIGFSLVWYGSNWAVALGLFLALFANNIGHSRKVRE